MNMNRGWYACFFLLAVLALSVGGLFAFRRLEANAKAARAANAAFAFRAQDGVPAVRTFTPIARKPQDYARFEAEDADWRQRNARQFTLSELRARGDGTRSPRESLQDRVYEHTRRGNRARAIAELERWVARYPDDERALLSLARLLNEAGRNADAITRYRQLLAIKQSRGTE
jgi:tetratricopeptide (TPR) repeat protein